MSDAFNGKQFQVAANRRLKKPLVIEVESWVQDWNDPNDEGGLRVTTFRIDPNVDMLRLGVAMGSMGEAMSTLGEGDVQAKLEQIDQALPGVRAALRRCVVPPDREKFDGVKEALGVQQLSDILQAIMGGMSGMDPTQQASSAPGSPATTTASTDGALPEGSTPAASPSPAA